MNTEFTFTFVTVPGTKTTASDIIRDTTGWVEYLSTTRRLVRTRMDVIHPVVGSDQGWTDEVEGLSGGLVDKNILLFYHINNRLL